MPSVPRRALHPRCHPERVRQHADDDVGVNVQEDKASVDDAVFHLVGQCRQVMQEHRGNRVTRSARKGSVHDWIVNGPRLLRPHIEHRAGMSANAGVCDEIPEQVCDGRRENVTLLRVRARGRFEWQTPDAGSGSATRDRDWDRALAGDPPVDGEVQNRWMSSSARPVRACRDRYSCGLRGHQ